MIDQLSIFMENKKGATKTILSLLADSDINVLGLINNDSAEFGILRLILSDIDKAEEILTREGYLCRKGKVLGIELDDTPGALVEMLSLIDNMNINVDYLYVGYLRENDTPVILLHTEVMPIVGENLVRSGYTVH